MIYIVGAGYMAREYAQVLKSLGEEFLVIGRSEKSVNDLKVELDIQTIAGGLSDFIKSAPPVPEFAIVCTPIDSLATITMELLSFGVRKILVEKPGALSATALLEIKKKANFENSTVLIGYNRRFYQSTLALEEHLKNENLIAANFEITEWSHVIEEFPCADSVKQKWVLANTSHVIDLVIHVTGHFKELVSFSSGRLLWHDSASRFVGSGVSENGVLISYHGYWDGPGRWSAEFVTTKNRYIFSPMEKLQVQKIGSVAVETDEKIDYSIDEQFKPGLYLQTVAFLNGNDEKLCSINEQLQSFPIYEKIANYN